jgi:type IV pilus assembly protein PilP
MRTLRRALLTLTGAGLIAGCAASNDFQDIKAFMDEVDSRGKGRIEPLPEFLPYQAFSYSAGNMRSPFEPPVVVKPIDPNKKNTLVKPDPNRVKQFLEQFNIGTIAMVGTLSQGARLYGLVRDPNGGVHRVQMGDYMGMDNGKILAINENHIELLEIVSDGTGGWVERERTVNLGGGAQS